MHTALLALLAAALAFTVGACKEEDTGTCCRSLSADAESAVPRPEARDGGIPRNLVGEHPAFDCEKLACVSWQGSEAFCTRRCDDTRPCPEGFDCRPVLESSPGAGAGIQPDDKFCVRKGCTTDTDCPEEWKCVLVHQGTDPMTDPQVKHCIKPDHPCAAR